MFINFDKIILENEQLELLNMIVEASRNIPHDKRQKFSVLETSTDDILIHPGLGGKKIIYFGDVEILARYSFVSLSSYSQSSHQFDVTPEGFRYYENLKVKITDANSKIESSALKYIQNINFEKKYPVAYRKWTEAEKLLWKSESQSQFTLIGHICREAMQEFTQHLVERYELSNSVDDKSKTINRLRTVFNHLSKKTSDTVIEFLKALISYWSTVNDLVQRQEHGGQKEGFALNWDDSRRIVFHTLLVMYEVDRVVL